jgi:tetratricopeptide (TPR) repeat protein
VTATLGNVYEPFLEYTHRPDILMRGLARGETLGDAAYRALPALSWQCILIGDPLYRPFAIALGEQLKHPERLPAGLGGYASMRLANLLDASRKPGDAVSALRGALAREPSLAVGMALAGRLQSSGSSDEAVRILDALLRLDPLPSQHWALARDAAELLAASGRPDLAVAAYRRLFAIEGLPVGMRAQWLVTARAAAIAVRNPEQASAWKQDLDRTVDKILAEKN